MTDVLKIKVNNQWVGIPAIKGDVNTDKFGLETGALSTDAEVLASLKARKISTFDLSKFTVVGSPTISDDGIVGGFSSTSYLTKENTFQFSSANSWKIIVPFKITDLSVYPQIIFDLHYSGTLTPIRLMYNNHNDWHDMRIGLANENGAIIDINTVTLERNIEENKWYLYQIEFTGTQYIISSFVNNNWVPLVTQASTSKIADGLYFKFGLRGVSAYPLTNGSIDLKQFSITVDGKPVFSGNKTGVDSVIGDNYTVVGSPTITDDGILQLSDSSNYINSSLTTNALSGKSWEIYTKVYWNGRNNGATNTFGIGDIYSYFRITQTQELVFNAYLASDNSQVYKAVFNSTIFSNAGWYCLKLTFDYATGTYKGYAGKEGNDLTELISITKGAGSEIRYLDNSHYILFNRSTTLNHEQDFNSFKIYVDGSLVYQPCLKIPYNQSKTGSKIVDSYYRSRVQDIYNQFGYAPYYTLSDSDFTLPKGDIYGFTTQILTEYRSGLAGYRIWNTGYCEQWGHLDNGTTVTFAKEFKDTNYNMQPYPSAKTATGCTYSSTTTDWVARGYLKKGEY